MKKMRFLVNPARLKRAASGKGRKRSATKRRKVTASTGDNMAKKRTRRRVSRRRNPVGVHHARTHHRKRRHTARRRNPMGNIPTLLMEGFVGGAYGVAGKAAARTASSKFGGRGTMMGYGIEAIIGVLGALMVQKFSRDGARAFLQGAFMSPIEELAISSNIPLLAPALGDYALFPIHPARQLLQPGSNVDGYPSGVDGYPTADGYPDRSMGDFNEGSDGYSS